MKMLHLFLCGFLLLCRVPYEVILSHILYHIVSILHNEEDFNGCLLETMSTPFIIIIIIMSQARISLILSCHFSLSFIASGRSSRLHPVSSHSCWMYVQAGRPAFARPYVGVHWSTSHMSSSLLLQQWPACLALLTWIVFVMGGRGRMLRAILNKSWRQHPTGHQLYGHLPPLPYMTINRGFFNFLLDTPFVNKWAVIHVLIH